MKAVFRTTYAGMLGIVGLTLAGPGTYLIYLGGSPYYLLAGLAVIAATAFLWRCETRRAALVYGVMLLGTLIWAVWESGLHLWPLVARIAGPIVLGAPLLATLSRDRRRLSYAPAALVAIFAALIVGGAFQGGDIRAQDRPNQAADGDWPHYGNTTAGDRFSPLDQINRRNVGRLKVAWTYRIGMEAAGALGYFEVTPIKVGERLFLCGSNNDVVALDASSGRQLWRWNSRLDTTGHNHFVCRGVSYYRVPAATGPCAERIYTATLDARLVALDAATGRFCPDFGANGVVDLKRGLNDPNHYYFVTSPPVVARGRLVLGGWVTDNQSVDEPSGVIRAFDAVRGDLAWAWDMGQPERTGEPGPGEHYTRGTPNSWAPMSYDDALGLVFVPTGNPPPDYFGAHRTPAMERYGSALVALDVTTGRPRWHFQTTHHDVWDYDVASQPTLLDLRGRDGPTPAVLQGTKRGQIFLLDRRDGRPLARVVERRAPQSGAAPGERLSPTQPFSVGMPSVDGPPLTEKMMWGITPLDQLWCRITFLRSRYHGLLTPIGLDWAIIYPANIGGMNWGGMTYDSTRGIAVVPASRMAMRSRLVSRAEANAKGYFPSRRGEAPSFLGLPQEGTPYGGEVGPFLSPLGVPCQEPPYATLTAIDMKSRRVLWSQPLGLASNSGPMGWRSRLPLTLGVPLSGGAITTAGGLTFIGASQDEHFRAIDTQTGAELWNDRLPAGGQATPMTYRSQRTGKQYVVIAAGGYIGYAGNRPGDYVVAYALD